MLAKKKWFNALMSAGDDCECGDEWTSSTYSPAKGSNTQQIAYSPTLHRLIVQDGANANSVYSDDGGDTFGSVSYPAGSGGHTFVRGQICWAVDAFFLAGLEYTGSNYRTKIYSSPTGIGSWTLVHDFTGTSGLGSTWINYFNGLLVLTSTESTLGIMTAPYSGGGGSLTWTNRLPAGSVPSVGRVDEAGGMLFLPSNATSMYVSGNGISWVSVTLPASTNWQSVGYGAEQYVAVNFSQPYVATSPDGVNWTQRTIDTNNFRFALSSDLDFMLICGDGGKMRKSKNGVNWIAVDPDTSDPIQAVVKLADYERLIGFGGTNMKTIAPCNC